MVLRSVVAVVVLMLVVVPLFRDLDTSHLTRVVIAFGLSIPVMALSGEALVKWFDNDGMFATRGYVPGAGSVSPSEASFSSGVMRPSLRRDCGWRTSANAWDATICHA